METVTVQNARGRRVDVTASMLRENWPVWKEEGWLILGGPPEILREYGVKPKPAIDPTAPWAQANNRKFGPKIKRNGPVTVPVVTPEAWPRRKRGVLVHIIAEPIRQGVGLVINVAECAEWAAGFADVHVIAPFQDSAKVPYFVKSKLHLVKDDAEGIALLRSLAPDLVRHHSPKRCWLSAGIDFGRGVIGTAHNWEGNVRPMHDWVVPICGPNVQIRHGVDLDVFKPKAGAGQKPKRLRVGIVGRIDGNKIPTPFVSALAAFDPTIADFHVYGPTLDFTANKTLEAKLGAIKHVTVHGVLPRNELPAVYQKLDVLLVTSAMEAVNRAAIEAMACGAPVIARDAGGLPDTVGDGGIICNSDADLLEAVKRMAGDRTRLYRLGEAARGRAEKLFDIRRMFDQYANIYSERSDGRVECRETGREAVFFANGIGNFIMATPFISNLNDPTVFVPADDKQFDAIKAISPWLVKALKEYTPGFDRCYAVWAFPPKLIPGGADPIRQEYSLISGDNEAESCLAMLSDPAKKKPIIKTTRKWTLRTGANETLIALVNGCEPRWKNKRWPIPFWCDLARMILKNHDGQFVYLGSAEEKPTGDALIKAVGNKCWNFAGALALDETADLVAQCDYIITTDSALMHVADAVGTQGLALFGATSWSKNRPLGGNITPVQGDGGECKDFPCYGKAPMWKCEAAVCLNSITPEVVYGRVKAMLGAER